MIDWYTHFNGFYNVDVYFRWLNQTFLQFGRIAKHMKSFVFWIWWRNLKTSTEFIRQLRCTNTDDACIWHKLHVQIVYVQGKRINFLIVQLFLDIWTFEFQCRCVIPWHQAVFDCVIHTKNGQPHHNKTYHCWSER